MERILKSKYKILEKIAESPSHNTYSGVFADSEKPIIIKIFGREMLNSVLTKKLKKDVQDLTRLESSRIPKVYDGDYGWQGFYFVRDFVNGKNLSELKMPLDIDTAGEYIVKICELLSFAHEKGFIHGSLTANNVFVLKNDIFVSDFGIESAVNQMLEQRTMFLFLPEARYLSPEMVLGESADIKSDIYQAGILLYLMLTGQLPMNCGTGLGSPLKSLTDKLPPPSSVNCKVPRYLDEIVGKCLEKEPLLRFESVKQISESVKNKALMIQKNNVIELPEINLELTEDVGPKDEAEHIIVPIVEEKSDKINLFRWVMLAVWTSIAAGIIYSLIQIFIIGE